MIWELDFANPGIGKPREELGEIRSNHSGSAFM